MQNAALRGMFRFSPRTPERPVPRRRLDRPLRRRPAGRTLLGRMEATLHKAGHIRAYNFELLDFSCLGNVCLNKYVTYLAEIC